MAVEEVTQAQPVKPATPIARADQPLQAPSNHRLRVLAEIAPQWPVVDPVEGDTVHGPSRRRMWGALWLLTLVGGTALGSLLARPGNTDGDRADAGGGSAVSTSRPQWTAANGPAANRAALFGIAFDGAAPPPAGLAPSITPDLTPDLAGDLNGHGSATDGGPPTLCLETVAPGDCGLTLAIAGDPLGSVQEGGAPRTASIPMTQIVPAPSPLLWPIAIAVVGGAGLAIGAWQFYRLLVLPLRKLNEAATIVLRQAQVDRPHTFQPDFDVSHCPLPELRVLGKSLEELGRWVGRVIDVLRHQALHDNLTGLPNETLLLERIRVCLNHQEQEPAYRFAILTLELESLRALRYAFGYRLGDRWLQAIARRLSSCTAPADTLARIDSHEFAILMPDVADIAAVSAKAALIHESMEFPQSVEGLSLSASTGIGIYWATGDIVSPDGCLQAASTAMLYAQPRGNGQTRIFDQQMQDSAAHRLELENELRRAIRRQQLHLLYQPIVNLSDRALSGFEVLVRWNHPQFGTISPSEFIPLAERTGSIVPLGLWVLERACQQVTAWAACFPGRPLKVNVNLSAAQLQQENLLAEIDRVLQSTGTPAALLKLEVTESILAADAQMTIAQLQAIRDRGIEVAIDDFGTGYSSLSYLQQLPVTTLKLDRAFVQDVAANQKNYNIVRTVAALARDLDLDLVAEGIETEAQARVLTELGCGFGQGYLFSKPVDCHDATQQLQEALIQSGESVTTSTI